MRPAIRWSGLSGLSLSVALLACCLVPVVATAGVGEPGGEGVYDFADAPDDPNVPGYPTLSAHDGARHLIGGPWFGKEGDEPDGEADGQPDPNALGDDADGNDDENGITIPPLHPGQMAVVTLDVGGIGGVVQAWVDFDANDVWQPKEQVFNGFLTDGPQAIAFVVPEDAVPGTTFARFRISSAGDLGPSGLAGDGEVEDHIALIEDLPDSMGLCQLPDVTQGGIDIRVDSNDGIVRWLADDVNAIGQISGIRLWGSWKDNKAGTIKGIRIAIYPNDPAGLGGTDPSNEYAKPERQEWLQGDFDPNEFEAKVYHAARGSGQWWWDPLIGELTPAGKSLIWQIDVPICTFAPPMSSIFWLAVAVETEGGEFGWRTRQRPDRDRADVVWDVGKEQPRIWQDLWHLESQTCQPPDANSVDMAFIVESSCCMPTICPTSCITCQGMTLCSPCVDPPTTMVPTYITPCPTQNGSIVTACGPCPTVNTPTCNCPTLYPAACSGNVSPVGTIQMIKGTPHRRHATRPPVGPPWPVVYSLQKDWLITNWTCPAIEVDCPTVVPEVATVSGENRQAEQPKVSKESPQNKTNPKS